MENLKFVIRKKQAPLYNPVKTKKPLVEAKPNNFYNTVLENKDVTKAFSQLSNCMSGMCGWNLFSVKIMTVVRRRTKKLKTRGGNLKTFFVS